MVRTKQMGRERYKAPRAWIDKVAITASLHLWVTRAIEKRRAVQPFLLPADWLREAVSSYLRCGEEWQDPGPGPRGLGAVYLNKTSVAVQVRESLELAAALREVPVAQLVREAASRQAETDLGQDLPPAAVASTAAPQTSVPSEHTG